MILILYKLITLEAFIWCNAVYDSMRIMNNKPIYHKRETLIRGAFMVVLAILFNWEIDAWKSLLFFIFWFWQYDYVLNYVRVKPWWYLGNSFLDKFLKGKNLRYIRLGLKVALIIGSFILAVI